MGNKIGREQMEMQTISSPETSYMDSSKSLGHNHSFLVGVFT